MAKVVLDTLGMKCPQPILEIAVKAADMKPGDILEILGDGPTFENIDILTLVYSKMILIFCGSLLTQKW